MNIKDKGSSLAVFKLSEFDPQMTHWGHTGYITVEAQPRDLRITDTMNMTIFFTPKKGTTFEQVEALARQMDELLEEVHFNTYAR